MLGLIGSLHCLGMCGPIVLALPDARRRTRLHTFTAKLIYNVGRVATYVTLGLVAGALGHKLEIGTAQGWLSILLGVAIIIGVIRVKWFPARPGTGTSKAWKAVMAFLLRQKSYPALFGIGLCNGLLPCGLVYVALAGAMATGTATSGAVFMALFGLGTTPAMLTVALAKNAIPLKFHATIRKTIPIAALLFGLLLVLRGLSLGIPYISPNLSPTAAGSHSHH